MTYRLNRGLFVENGPAVHVPSATAPVRSSGHAYNLLGARPAARPSTSRPQRRSSSAAA